MAACSIEAGPPSYVKSTHRQRGGSLAESSSGSSERTKGGPPVFSSGGSSRPADSFVKIGVGAARRGTRFFARLRLDHRRHAGPAGRDLRILLKELDESGKHVLITEHAYAPEYDRAHDSGRFCVQFLTFDRSDSAREVMRWWQDRCVEWCFARYENGKFGDQVYLDQWPTLFGDRVHIVRQVEKTLAPWNVLYFSRTARAEKTAAEKTGSAKCRLQCRA